MIPRRLVSVLLAGAALASAAMVQFVLSGAGFSSASPARSGAVSSATDWVAPTQSSAVLAKTTGGTPSGATGALHQGATYRVYATASDGNSGLASVTANVASLTTGQTAVAMTAGSYAVDGTTYNYASAEMTANGALSEGTKSFSIVATDQATNARTTAYSATVDNTAPSASMTDPGAYLRRSVTLGATASDTGTGLESLKIRIAPTGTGTWTTVCTTATSPASCSLDTTAYTDGGYDVQALATDQAGNTMTSTVASRTIDNAAPTIARTVLVRTTGGVPEATAGFVRQGGTYRVYAQAGDATSGLNAVTVDASALTTGQTAATMSSGSFTVNGQAYNYASAELTANGTLSEGAKSVVVRAADNATNATTLNPAAAVDNTVPSASMTDPGANLKGTLTLNATASDTVGLESLKIRISPAGTSTWTTVCTVAASPAACSFDSTAYIDGGYDLQALAIDRAGNATTSTVGNRRIDNTAPAMARTVLVRTASGAPGASTGYVHQGGTYRIYAQASDGGSGVNVVSGNASSLTTGESSAAMTAGSYTVAGQTYNYASAELTANAILSEGAKTVTVTATDNATNSGTTNAAATVDNTAPTTSMTNPGTYLKGTVTLGATASDPSAGVESLVIRSAPTGTTTWTTVCTTATSPASCSLDTTAYTDGGYDFQSLATDAAGNTSTSTQSNRTIDNAAPVIARTVLVRTTGGTPAATTGFVRQAGTYRVYAQVSDATSGVAGVTVNASSVTTGQTAATMSSGSFTVAGQAYNYASAELTANATLAEGAKTVTVSATDNAANSGTLNPSATVDNTAPSASMTDPGAYMRAVEALGATGSDTSAGLESLVIRFAPAGTTTWTTVCTVNSSPASCNLTTTSYTDGLYDVQALATDGAGNTATSTVTNRKIDNTAPTAASISTTNVNKGTLGKPEAGDTIIYGFSEPMDPASLLTGWNGTSSAAVTLRINNASPDNVQVFSGTTQLNFGTVSLAQTNYVTATANFNATMVMSGNNVTITLGTLASGTVSTGAASIMTWSPSTPVAPLDLAGNSMTTATRNSAAAVKNF